MNLTEIHRQSDKVFIDILQKLRLGLQLPPKDVELLLHHPSQTRNAVKLFGSREEVKRLNDQKFDNLCTKARGYMANDDFQYNEVSTLALSSFDRGHKEAGNKIGVSNT